MSHRPICGCPLCQLEKGMIAQFESGGSRRWYGNLSARIPALTRFPEVPVLIAYMHDRHNDAENRHLSDSIYGALLREVSTSPDTDLLQSLLLQMLIPALHRELRTIGRSFQQLLPEDIAQQLVTTCIQVVLSENMRRKDSYLGKSIVERTRRDAIRWAIHQYRTAERAETGVLVDDVIESYSAESRFEPAVLLRQLLERSVSDGLISETERKLLLAYEVEGLSAKELGNREGLSPATLSQKVRRALDRLNRNFSKPQTPTEEPTRIPPK
jgi:DNA-directed RNA polymerase specialized sigma24 family protein